MFSVPICEGNANFFAKIYYFHSFSLLFILKTNEYAEDSFAMLQFFKNLAPEGAAVIFVILSLFALAVILLFSVYIRYKALNHDLCSRGGGKSSFATELRLNFQEAYEQYGLSTNTPGIIDSTVSSRLSGLLFCERFMNNAVTLFVTLGLFGTFLGLALSVSSLTELLQSSNSDEWLNVLNSVGSGLFSSLSGMGVAFYTSLVGVACSIIFTVLRSIFNPQAQREALETTAELWLDHIVAPQSHTEYAADDATRFMQLKEELRSHAQIVENSLNACTQNMSKVLNTATDSLGHMIDYSKEPLRIFYDTVQTFNDNVRDFSAVNYDLRGSIERMDLAVRDFGTAVNRATGEPRSSRRSGGSEK